MGGNLKKIKEIKEQRDTGLLGLNQSVIKKHKQLFCLYNQIFCSKVLLVIFLYSADVECNFWVNCTSPTYNDECVVDVHATKSVGGLADIRPRVLRLHFFDAQGVLQHSESRPAAVDVAAVFGPHDERRRVALHRAGQLHCAAQAGVLPVGHSLRHPRRSWKERRGGQLSLGPV